MSSNNPSPRHDHLKIEIRPTRENAQSMGDVGLRHVNLLDVLAQFEEYGIWRFDLDEGLAYFSRDACILQGMPPTAGAVNLVRLARHYHPEDRPHFLQCFEDASAQKPGFRFVLRTIVDQDDDHPRIVEVCGRYRRNERNGEELFGTIRQVHFRVRSVSLER